MTQLLLGINGALIAALAALSQVEGLSADWKSVIAAGLGIAIAFIAPFMPKVSLSVRRMMGLRTG